MNKKFVTIVIVFIIFVIFINAFSPSYASHNISNLAYVLALGIDKGEKSKLKISAQFTKNSTSSNSESSSSSSNIVLVTGEAESIFSGLNLLNSYIGKEINLAHCSVVIFSEEFAKEGISTEIYSLLNNEEIRPSANIVVSKCSAYDYLNNSIPNIEKMTVKYYETFSITSRFTGYITNITIGDFYNNLSSPYSDSTAILGGLNATARKEDENSKSDSSSSSDSSSDSGGSETINSQESSLEDTEVVTNPEDLMAGNSSVMGNRGTENIGIAVFKDDKLCGELTATESICHLLIGNEVDLCIITIDDPFSEDEKMELQLAPAKKSKVNVNIKDDKIHVSINMKLDADILTLQDSVNYEDLENLEKVSSAAENYLKSEFTDYFNKVTREFGIDIDHFCVKALTHFATNSEWESFNWKEKLKNAEFNLHIDVDTISSLLVTKT